MGFIWIKNTKFIFLHTLVARYEELYHPSKVHRKVKYEENIEIIYNKKNKSAKNLITFSKTIKKGQVLETKMGRQNGKSIADM